MHSLLQITKVCALAVFVALTGCAGGDLVVLLPDDSGKVGKLAVSSEGRTVLLDSAGASTQGAGSVTTLSDGVIKATFGDAIAAEPPQVERYQLYFLSGSTRIESTSQPDLDAMLKNVNGRPVAEVQVTGHTDRVGAIKANDALGLRRANQILDELVQIGLRRDAVRAVSRGEREPLVATDDGVANAKNRRVEIIVR
jgi:outer membrane protein OmpA-like peptidoglycan-associated protein